MITVFLRGSPHEMAALPISRGKVEKTKPICAGPEWRKTLFEREL